MARSRSSAAVAATFDSHAAPPRRNDYVVPGRPMLRSVLRLVLTALSAILYALVAWQTYLAQSPGAIVAMTLTWTTGVILMTTPIIDSRLNSFQIVSAAFLVAFAIGPLAEVPDVNYAHRFAPLAATSALYIYASYLALAAGYHAHELVDAPLPPDRLQWVDPSALKKLALRLFAVGFLFYLMLLAALGGPSYLFSSDQGRSEMFIGFGFLGWPTGLMISGSVLHCAAELRDPRVKASRALRYVALCVMLLVPLQGRSRAAQAAAASILVFYHSGRRVRWGLIGVLGVVAYLASMFVGFSRQLWVRPLLIDAPMTALSLFAEDFTKTAYDQLAGSLARLWTVMLVIDRIPDEIPYQWGSSFLFILNPITRRLGLGEIWSLGYKLWEASVTINPADLMVGLNPSLVGEMRANFPWPLALLVLALVGYVMRRLHKGLLSPSRGVAGIALYGLVISALSAAVISSLGNDLIYSVTSIGPPWLAIFWMELRSRSAHRYERANSARARAPG